MEIAASRGLVVDRVERAETASIGGALFRAVGRTVSRLTQLVDPAASFAMGTPDAATFVRGTTP
jgi:hypothetical protein